jgi:cytochrome P450
MTTTDVKPTQTVLPPGPKPVFPFEQLIRLRRNPIKFITQMTREYGDIVRINFGPQMVIILNDPEYIKDVFVTNQKSFKKGRGLERAKGVLGEGLLTAEGEFHLRQRRLAQPAFHKQRVASYADVMVQYAERSGNRWHAGEKLDIAEEMMRLTMAIVGKTLFDADVENEATEVGDALTAMMKVFNLMTLPFAEYIEKLPIPSLKRARAGAVRLEELIYKMIAERRASGEDKGDLLSMLLQSRDEEGDGTGMTDKQVRDESLTLFLAGHETTANALTWAWYLLSQNPDIEAKFHAELKEVLNGRLPTFDDVANLSYTRMVLAEAIRLYPPAWLIGRRALVDHTIDGYSIPAHTIILTSPYLIQHDPRYYPDPEKFDPTRWTPAAQAQRPKFTYFPFGGGTRICIGESFAWMEGVLILAVLGQQWQMRHVESHKVELQPIVTLRPKHGMQMTVQKR